RSGDGRVRYASERGSARFQRGVTADDLFELLIELFLIEELAAGGAIDFGAQLSDTIFVGVLHVSLAGDQACEDIIPKRKIGCSGGRPHAEHDDSADHDPEYHRSEPDLFAGVHQRIAGPGTWCGRSMARG